MLVHQRVFCFGISETFLGVRDQWGHVLSRLKFPDQLLAQNMKPLSFCRQMKKKKRSQRRTAVGGGLGMAGIGEGIGVNLNSNKISGIR